ncbi:carboxypeptidase regulatory-like domain-containing protein [candidate division WOR-3 bacterium]|nr:carboxypeptidase regulatory-like domain-containing protein [candidate division WOR-3 bacterium]
MFTFYDQREHRDSLEYSLSSALALEWKPNSFLNISGGFTADSIEEKAVFSPYFSASWGGPGGAFIDLGANFTFSDRGYSAALIGDIQKNKACGLQLSPGYFWEEGSSFSFLTSRIYFSRFSNRTYIEVEKRSGERMLSFDNSFLKFGILADFFGGFSFEILTTVRLGSKTTEPDWTLGLKVFSGFVRDPSSVRGTGTLSGTVRSEEGLPIDGAIVCANIERLMDFTTDSTGFFSFSGIPSGFVTISVSSEGFREIRMPVSVRKNQNVHLDIVLEDKTKSVQYNLSLYDFFSGLPTTANFAGSDGIFTDTLISIGESETLFVEKDNYLTAHIFSQNNQNIRVPMLPIDIPFSMNAEDFEDSSLSSSGMMKIMEIKHLLDFYPYCVLRLEGHPDYSEIIRNSLFTFFSLDNEIIYTPLHEDSSLNIYFEDSNER